MPKPLYFREYSQFFMIEDNMAPNLLIRSLLQQAYTAVNLHTANNYLIKTFTATSVYNAKTNLYKFLCIYTYLLLK